MRDRVAAQFKVLDLPPEPPLVNGETRLAAEAALASFRGEIVPNAVKQRMMATLERLRG